MLPITFCPVGAECYFFESKMLEVGTVLGMYRVIPEWYHGGMAFTVRTDAALEEALDSLAQSEGISRQEIVRRAVLERYERSDHVSRTDDAARRMAARWGDVLERLGSA
jgi:predicted transcriptional regulator